MSQELATGAPIASSRHFFFHIVPVGATLRPAMDITLKRLNPCGTVCGPTKNCDPSKAA